MLTGKTQLLKSLAFKQGQDGGKGGGQSRQHQPGMYPSRWVASSPRHPARCHKVQGFKGHSRDPLEYPQLLRDEGRLVERGLPRNLCIR